MPKELNKDLLESMIDVYGVAYIHEQPNGDEQVLDTGKVRMISKEQYERSKIKTEEDIIAWLTNHFDHPTNGYETKMPFPLIYGGWRFYSVDSIVESEAYTRFQGVLSYRMNGKMYVSDSFPEIPLFLFPYISSYKISQHYKEINKLCWTIWFKEPLTKELWDRLVKENS